MITKAAKKKGLVGLVGLSLLFALTAGSCSSGDDDEREALQSKKATGHTLEKANLEEKRKREENANAIGYVYVISFAQPIGYYVTKGKISASGSQATPEEDIHWTCRSGHGCTPVIVDGAQDDGSYGGHDPGIFFFTTNGAKVVTSLDYIHSDQPLPINVPLLGGTAPR